MSPDVKNDPIARNLQWTPVAEGGSNFRTHTRVDDALRIVYKPSIYALVNIVFFAAIILIFVYQLINEDNKNTNTPLFLLFCVLFFGIFIYTLFQLFKPRVFDLSTRVYRYGWRKPQVEIYYLDNKNCISFEHIHAIQLVDEFIETDDGDYTSTELNLILKDKQ